MKLIKEDVSSSTHFWSTTQCMRNPNIPCMNMRLVFTLQVGHVKQRGKPKPADADSQQLAEQAFEELLDHIQGVPANYIIDDSK